MINDCLVAVSGDCSEGGMNDKATFINLEDKGNTLPLICDYLRNQLEINLWNLENDYFELSNENPDSVQLKKFTSLLKTHNELGNALIEANVFLHKWHKRTQWILDELVDGKPSTNRNAKLEEMEG
jgi:hypothetical protein